MNNLIFILHIFSCFFMTGLIWLIQLVHYPSFRFIPSTQFAEFHAFHSKIITLIVGPVMLLELITAFLLMILNRMSLLSSVNLLGVIVVWLATVFLSVPTHNKLTQIFNLETINFLVHSNWIRTAVWSARSLLLIYLILMSLKNYEIKI